MQAEHLELSIVGLHAVLVHIMPLCPLSDRTNLAQLACEAAVRTARRDIFGRQKTDVHLVQQARKHDGAENHL